jgi:hypothetical protein
MGEERGGHRVLVGKPEGKRPLGRPRRRWEDNIKMDVQEVGGGRGDWMELALDRDRWRAFNSDVEGLIGSCTPFSFIQKSIFYDAATYVLKHITKKFILSKVFCLFLFW